MSSIQRACSSVSTGDSSGTFCTVEAVEKSFRVFCGFFFFCILLQWPRDKKRTSWIPSMKACNVQCVSPCTLQ